MGFDRVKEILDGSLSGWAAANGGLAPDLSGHGATFKWSTKQELLDAVGHTKRLIDPTMIGNGKGAQTALVIDLRTGIPRAGRMPKGGPFLSDPEIQEIEDWINDGCPD